MSEPAPEPGAGGAPAAGGFMSKRFLGIPAIVWLIGAAILAYLYFRNSSSSSGGGATSTGGGGTATTGNIQLQPGTSTVDIQSQYDPTQTTTNGVGPRHGTHNPQPDNDTKPTTKKHQTKVRTPGKSAAQYVTVGKWTEDNAPWNSTLSGIAQHEHISLKTLEKLNPQIKNPNLIDPGEKVRVK